MLPAMEASSRRARANPSTADSTPMLTESASMSGSRSVSRYAAAGGAIIRATTSTVPAASNELTAVTETSVMRP